MLCCFFNDTATTEIYTLSLHDALPISLRRARGRPGDTEVAERFARAADVRRAALVTAAYDPGAGFLGGRPAPRDARRDRKSTRLNSSHSQISYAVFCLKKKKENIHIVTDGLRLAESRDGRDSPPALLAPSLAATARPLHTDQCSSRPPVVGPRPDTDAV